MRNLDRLIVRGGAVADGTGAPIEPTDVLIGGDLILEVGPPGAFDGLDAPVIEVAGQIVSPGFIDVHSHADNAPFLEDDDTTKILQGVTTEVVGNCGFSLAPVAAGREQLIAQLNERLFPPLPTTWSSWSELMSAADANGYVTNYAPLVGHNAVRIAAMGTENRAASPDEIKTMCWLIDEAQEGGAFGLSSGLIYPPGVFSTTGELVALAARLRSGRVYATHMRDEGDDLSGSIAEAVEIGRRSGSRVQISHLKVTGAANWGHIDDALAMLDAARSAGVDVRQDAYPYEASSTMLASCLPASFQSGTEDEVLARLDDHDQRALIRRAFHGRAERGDGSWASRVVIASTASHRNEGRTLAEIAAESGGDDVDALCDVLVSERLRVSMIHFSMCEADVEAVLAHPVTMIGSDGLPPGVGGRPHPRLFGTFPRVLGRYVRDRKVMSLSEAIAKMTSLPADAFGLDKRGRIRPGEVADLVCFDPDRVIDGGDYTSAAHDPVGISWVMQAGELVVQEGRWLGRRRGKRLAPR